MKERRCYQHHEEQHGAFTATFAFDGSVRADGGGGSVVIYSLAARPGTYNPTSLMELLLSYIAGQLGTTLDGLLAGIQSNTSFQKAFCKLTLTPGTRSIRKRSGS
jgi:hypothetical protein